MEALKGWNQTSDPKLSDLQDGTDRNCSRSVGQEASGRLVAAGAALVHHSGND